MKKLRIALVEIGGSHDECLLTQMHAIRKRGHQIILITTPNVAARNPAFNKYVSETFLVDPNALSRKKVVRSIWKKLKVERVNKAVFNTAQGKIIRDLCLKAMMHSMEFIGVIHTTRMFTESFTQKIIHRKIKKYFLLSEYLVSKITPPKGISVDYFYPLRFPKTTKPSLEKTENTLVIIGGVEERRKDLMGFLEMLEAVREEDLRCIFLGKSDANKPEVQAFSEQLKTKKLAEKVTLFDQFVPQDLFNQTVQQADLILPLVHPETPSADQYFRNQISGAMTVSFGYKVPMLIHEAYQHIEEMQPASFYYTLESFGEILPLALQELEEKKERIRNQESYSTEENERRYADFLGME